MTQFRANVNELQKITKALEGLHKSALPVAIRQTLNDLAFDGKKKQLIKTANKNFTVRNKSFLNKFSKVNKAKGLNISSMKSEMGMVGRETENFHEQEIGGSVSSPVIASDRARISGNKNKRVRKANYLSGRNSVRSDARTRLRRNRKSQFVANAFYSFNNRMLLRHDDTLFEIKSIRKKKKGGINIRMNPLYNVKAGRKVPIKATKFIEETATQSLKKLNRFYAKNANQRFKKHLG